MFRTLAQFEEQNKMSARNIAIVMNPSLFRFVLHKKKKNLKISKKYLKISNLKRSSWYNI